jgi:cytochrome c-type biogenesis protein
MTATFAFALLAGVLSTLSPCVLPLLPIVLAGAAGGARHGVYWIAGGLASSFAAIGIFVATVGFAIGFDGDFFRLAGGMLMVAFGVVLAAPPLQVRFAAAMGPVGDWTERRFGGFSTDGAVGQFGLGALLGAVWSPCVGPTLGAASVMAARGENLAAVAATMLAFGIGAALPLLVLGRLSRERFAAWRGRLAAAGSGAKTLLGAVLASVGILVLTGADKRLEAALVERLPDWLVNLTTAF